jgi:hypothetical protein
MVRDEHPLARAPRKEPIGMQCPNCHKPLSAGARFCGACGTQIPAPASPLDPSGVPGVPPPVSSLHKSWMNKGFFKSLFDLSFSSFVTTKVVKVIYVLTLVWIGLWAVAWIIWAFDKDPGLGALFLLVVAPLLTLFSAVYARMILEFIMAVFRIAEYQRDQVALTQHQVALAEANGHATAV